MDAEETKEPMLVFEDGVWHGFSTTQRVTLTEQALQREIVTYLEKQGITDPTSGERSQALRAIKRVSYWDKSRNGAPDIHVVSSWQWGQP